jgi:DNA-binding response OmpR family regulator
MRIAVFDGDPIRTDFSCQALSAAGHVCHAFSAWRMFTNRLRRETFDLVLLDWSVPDVSGEDALSWLRQNISRHVPVLCMTSRDRDTDVASMLNMGADSYIVTPIAADILLAHVGSMLRRAYPPARPDVNQTFDGVAFDRCSERVIVQGKHVVLTQKEFALAHLLFQHLNQPVSRAHIMEAIWKRVTDVPSRTMDTHISILRGKLGLRPENGYRLVPIYGYGYRLERIEKAHPAAKRSEFTRSIAAEPAVSAARTITVPQSSSIH